MPRHNANGTTRSMTKAQRRRKRTSAARYAERRRTRTPEKAKPNRDTARLVDLLIHGDKESPRR